ncbi:transcriptional regulatory protein DegU [mine drainage metagenome]|uniref:Transcriptional regulatory protein DegU n=1 Tax=mine drainage metagenome TaxID=410659 RepID=A0A1J5T581_9ZZZZ
MALRVFIVDDHQIVRDGLKLILRDEPDFEVAGEAANGQSALDQIAEVHPDIVTTDIEMPGIDGIALARQIKARAPHVKILILSAHSDTQYVREALKAGVAGFLLKLNASRDFVQAIRTVMEGQTYLCPEVSTVVVREYQRHVQMPAAAPPAGPLSDREREILKCIADGRTTKETALTLSLSTKTIEAHRLNIMAKLKINSIAELTKYAIREGIVQL